MNLHKLPRTAVAAARRLCLVLLLLIHASSTASGRADSPTGRASPGTAPGQQVAWLAGDGKQARHALRLLDQAADHGLDSDRYGTSGLTRRLDGPRDASATAALEHDLGNAMLRYLTELHVGRAASAYRTPGLVPDPFDPQAALAKALDDGRLEQAVDAAVPTIPLYRRVMASLAQYRELARRHPSWPSLPPLPGAHLSVDDTYMGVPLVRERLQLLGDLNPSARGDETSIYTAALAAGIRRFQGRHGLVEDGVLGAQTLAALSVSPSHRANQLVLTLERLRWLPPLPQGRIIAVNLPAYRLWAFDTRNLHAAPALEMRVIVGTAARTPTPLFIGQMRYLELNPYWNVPRSIAVGEIVPTLARNPAYLRQNDMELVTTSGGAIMESGDAVSALRSGGARVRQRPGPQNVLGGVKFAMPNPMNIYLHSTSAQELFDRNRRDLSHGCIRVEHPVALAEFVLADTRKWNTSAIEAAIDSGKTRTLTLPDVVPVVLFYATAVTDREGRVLFADDIYGHDAALRKTLRAH